MISSLTSWYRVLPRSRTNLIGAVLPRELDYLAKTELFRIPGFGALIRRLNAHPVDRSGSDSAALRLALRLLGDGRAVLVFPEGTRGTEGHLQPARPGKGSPASLMRPPRHAHKAVPLPMLQTGSSTFTRP